MTITQTIDIPADRRITLPREVPTGRTIITFTPAPETDVAQQSGCPICAKYRDPKSGALRPNAETIAAIEEGRAMMRGEIPANRFNSFDEMWENLMKDDPSEDD